MPSPDQLRILTVIFFFLLLFLGVSRPIYAVAAYMVLVYCKVSGYYNFFAQIRAELLFAILIFFRVVATGNLAKILPSANNVINKYLLYFVFCVVLSFGFAWNHQYSWDHAVYHYMKTLVLYILILGAIETKHDLKIFIWSFMFLFLYLSYEPAYGFLTQTAGNIQMYGTNYVAETGILAGHVALANNMNQMLPLAWFLFLGGESKIERIMSIICFVIFFIALIGSGSRGGIVGMVAWGSMVVWFSKNRFRASVLMFIVLVVMIISAGSSVFHTASRIQAESTAGRLSGISHGAGMIMKGNIFGVGPGCYLFGREKYFHFQMESHNLYGQIMGDLGIPGTIAVFFLMREVFRVLAQVKRTSISLENGGKYYYNLMVGIQVSFLVRLLISLGSHGLYYFYWYVLIAFVLSSQRLVETDLLVNNKPDKSPY